MSYTITLVQDLEAYEHGDYESDEQRDEVNDMIDRDGVWGYVVEKTSPANVCPHCGADDGSELEEVESCFGFIGTKQAIENALMSVPKGEPVDLHDEYGVHLDSLVGTGA